MTLKNRITKEQNLYLKNLAKKYTFDHKSENLNFFTDNRLTDNELQEVESIMNNSIGDYSKFRFFLGDKIYFNYQWDANFTGIGDIKIDELLNGFDPYTSKQLAFMREFNLLSEDEIEKYKDIT